MANQESRLAIVIDSQQAEQNIKRLRTALKNIGKETVEAGSGLELLTEAMEPLKKYDSVFTKASGAAKDLAKSTKDMSKEVLAASKGISTLNDDTKKSADSSNKLQTAVDNTAKEVREFGAITDAAGVAVWGMGDKAEESAQDVDKLGDKAKDAKSGLKGLGDEAEKSKSKLEKLKDSVSDFNESMSGLRNAGLVMAGALTGVLYTAVNAAMDFESAMADVKKVVDFDTPDGLQKMSDDLLEMSTRIPIAAEGLAQIAAAAGQSGIAADEITRFTEAAAKMGTAFDITADEAGTAMAEMRVAFGFTQNEVETLVDQINYLGNTTPNASKGLTEVVQRIGAIANISGVSASQLAAMAGSITSLAPEQVATGLKNLMTRMTAGAAATKPMKAAWHDLGFTAQEVAKRMQEDSEGMINAMLESVAKLPKEEQTAYLNTLFGQEALPVIAQMMTNTEMLTNNLNAMGDASLYAGSAQAEFEARNATVANQLELLGNNLNVAKVTLGEIFLPMVNDLAEGLMPVIESFSNWARENPVLVQTIAAVAAVVSGLLLGVTGLGLAFAGAISMATGFQAIGAVLAPVLAGLSLPIMGVVAAIAAVIAIGVALYKNWDTVKEKAGQLGSYLSTEFAGVKESVSSVVDGIKNSFNSIVQTVSPALQAVADVFKGTFDSFVQIAQGVLQLVVNTVKTQFMAIVTTIGAVLQIAFTVFKAGFDLIKNSVMTVMKIIVAIIDGDFKRIPKIMGEGISQGVAIVGNALGKIVNVIKDYGKRMFNLGKDFMQGFINGIKSLGSGVVGAASTMASNAVAAVRRAQDSHSPSKKTLKLGKDFGKGFANGIKASKKPVVTEAQKLAEQAVKAVKDTIATLQRDIALFGNDDPIAAMLWDRANTDKYKGVDNSLFNQAVDLTKQKQALDLGKKFEDALKSIEKTIKDSSVSTELQKWYESLRDGSNELSRLDLGKKIEVLEKAANLDYSNLSKEMAKSSLEIDRQVELLGVKSDLDKELMQIGYEANDLLEKYNFYLEQGQIARYNEIKAMVMGNAEREKGLAILKEEQKLKDSLDSDLSGIRTELLGYGINETDSDKNDYQLADTLERLRQAHEMQLMQQDEFQKLSEIAKQRHADKMAEIENAMYQNRAGLFASASKALLGENSRTYKLMFAIEKGYALQSAWLKSKKAVLDAYADTPGSVWNKAWAAAKAAADTGLMAAAIAAVQAPIGQAHDGIMSVPKSGTWNLEKGERVLPAHTAKAMDKKLEQGGKVIIHNYSGEKAEAKQDMDGNTIITIGKMVNGMIDAKISNWERKAQRQGGLFSGA